MKTLYKLKDFLEDEIEECTKKDTISSQELDGLYKMVDILKDITEIEEKKMEMDEGYSQSYYGKINGYRMMGTGTDDYGNSYRRGRDARTGRYTSRDGSMSRDSEKDEMISRLETMMDTAGNEKERTTILRCIEQLKD